jgi:Calcineurin-like phosphoesterase
MAQAPKIAIFSDTHQEMHNYRGNLNKEFGPHRPFWTPEPDLNCDYIFMLGDNATRPRDLQRLAIAIETEQPRVKAIIYIGGNHEKHRDAEGEQNGEDRSGVPWGPDGDEQYRQALRQTQKSVYLEKETYDLGAGWIVAGTTLWTDLSNPKAEGLTRINRRGDFKCIEHADGTLITPSDVTAENAAAWAWIEQMYANCEPQKTILITHHALIRGGVITEFPDEMVDLYGNKKEMWLSYSDLAFVANGHTHTSTDEYLGKTRRIVNARGYWPDINPNFKVNLIIDLNRTLEHAR